MSTSAAPLASTSPSAGTSAGTGPSTSSSSGGTVLDPEVCYRAVSSRDRRFDGTFWTAVHSTRIYCRPSCPARTPAASGVTFHPSAASAQRAGFRACKRCLPDAAPGSPEWDVAADLAGRAMRLISDGVVDRDGVDGLADALGYTPRHVARTLTAELGAGPLALARARRAQTARTLLQSSELAVTDIAYAAGFSSVRQFNDTIREVYGTAPRELRGRRSTGGGGGTLTLALRIAVRTPYAGIALRDFLAHHVVVGVESVRGTTYARTLDLPHGAAIAEVDLADHEGSGTAQLPVRLHLADLRDTSAAIERVRRLLDADADVTAASAQLGADPLIGPLVSAAPGLRVPGSVDGPETAVRAVIGQQVSVLGARTVTRRLVESYGRPLPASLGTVVPGLTHLFPRPAALAQVDPEDLPMPRARGRAIVGLATALVKGEVRLDRGPDRALLRTALLALPGVGAWTADVIALRALGDPDVFLPSDLGVRRAVAALREPSLTPEEIERWRPWRSYALLHLWNTLMPPADRVVDPVAGEEN